MTAGPPPLRRLALPDRQWVDLFYDLAFAAGIIALSGAYAQDYTALGAVWFAIVYAVLWCTWLLTGSATGSFVRRSPPHTVASLVLLVAQMACLLLLSVTAGDTLAESEIVFDVLLGIILVLAAALALRGHRAALSGQRPAVAHFALALMALAISWRMEGTLSLLLWLSALGILGLAAWSAIRRPGVDPHRLVHRLAELTVIVIGEVLVKLTLTLGEESVWSARLSAILAVFVILVGIWLCYFLIVGRIGHHATPTLRWWVAAHLPLHLGVLASAVGLAKLSVGAETIAKPGAAAALLAGPLVLVFIGLLVMFGASRTPTTMLWAGTVVVILVAAGTQLHRPLLVAYAAGIVLLGLGVHVARLPAAD